ncbi:hypothetical protein QLH52_22035 [Methylomonas sp. OY6]|uniref:Secreted protein with PEP-CTERM sorting signal n=1 Tax=Methylomonas defluvii TaxID=3045149 RepID=A0ABU4UMC2_9GAMM|nr:hypothetical protein [Methylomonas sp. OY6]MDX8129987.1 hypothetical protein [Methylomonas sp. OY6]
MILVRMLFIAAAFAVPLLSNVALASTVLGVPCYNEPICATDIKNLEFQGKVYDVSFTNNEFYKIYPNPSDYLFWGDPMGATQMTESIIAVLSANGIIYMGEDSGSWSTVLFSNGFSMPYRPLNDFVAYSIVGAYWGSAPSGTWNIYQSTHNLQGGIFPEFTNVSAIPLPSTILLFSAGLMFFSFLNSHFRKQTIV